MKLSAPMRQMLIAASLYLGTAQALGKTPVAPATDNKILTFGIVPQQSATTLARLWVPLLRYLSDKTGYQLRFATAPDIPTFEKRLAVGEYDIAYMNPYHFTVFNETPGYRALARARDKRIQGIIVVREHSPYQTLDELRDATLALPAPAAFAASLLTRAEFQARGIPVQPDYVRSHDSVYRAVAKGLYPAGGGIMRTYQGMAPEIREQLRVLWTTKGYTPHAIATHPRVSEAARAALGQALIGMSGDPVGQARLAALNLQGLERARDADWEDVRALDINLLGILEHPE